MRATSARLDIIDDDLRKDREANRIFLDLLLKHGNPETRAAPHERTWRSIGLSSGIWADRGDDAVQHVSQLHRG